MTWAKLDTAAVARALSAVAAEPGDLAEVYFERRIDAEWPPAETSCGLRLRSEEGLAVRLVRGDRAWIASRDGISGGELLSALRQVARAQPPALVEPELAGGPLPAVPVATLRGFAAELERGIRRHHVAFPFRLTTRWRRLWVASAMGANGTPMIVTDKGAILPGYVPAAQLAKIMDEKPADPVAPVSDPIGQ